MTKIVVSKPILLYVRKMIGGLHTLIPADTLNPGVEVSIDPNITIFIARLGEEIAEREFHGSSLTTPRGKAYVLASDVASI